MNCNTTHYRANSSSVPGDPTWLYETTRYTATRVQRSNIRRHHREQEAYMQSTLTDANTDDDWHRLVPHLEAAMSDLGENDRTLLALRFYENKSGPQAAALLGIREAAVHKRSARALEKLRKFFTRRGVALSTAAIAAAISSNSVSAAPVGLAVSISAAALSGTTLTTTAFIAATKAIAMTTLQKTLITLTLAATVGVGLYEAKVAAQARANLQTLQRQQAPLTDQNQQLQRERDDATNRLAGLLAENARLKSNANQNELLRLRGEMAQLKTAHNDPANQAEQAWLDRVHRLKQRMADNPDARIPEFQFLTEQDWLSAASGKLDTDTDYRKAFATLRNTAENKFASQVQTALQKYSQANGAQFPTDLSQLQPYFDSPVDDSILQRWEITPAQTVPNLGMGDPIITQKTAVDDLFDLRFAIGPRGFGNTDFLSAQYKTILGPVYQAYTAANHGQDPATQSQLLPYATTPDQQALLQKVMLRDSLTKQ